MKYYFINNKEYSNNLEYYYDLARQISNDCIGIPAAVMRVINSFTVMTYADYGPCGSKGIMPVRLEAGVLLLKVNGKGISDDSFLSFEKDEKFEMVCEIDEEGVHTDNLELVTDFNDCISDGLMFFPYGDGTCSVIACGINDLPEEVAVPEHSPSGDRVTVIEDHAFNCRKIKKLYLPGSIEEVGGQAFFLSSVNEIVFSSDLKYIAEDAFDECHAAARPQVAGHNGDYSDRTYRKQFFMGYYSKD